MTAPAAGGGRARSMSLVFRFLVTIDDRKAEVANRPGDAIVLRQIFGGGTALDEALAAGGTEAYEVMFRFAWRALRHHDDYRDVPWDEFLERCEAWDIVNEPGEAARPTGAGRSNAT